MRPSGPRTRRPEASSSQASSGSRSASGSRSQPLDRDDAFKSIFGRTAAGHHMRPAGQAAGGGYVNPPQAYPPHMAGAGRGPIPPANQSIYDAFAPPLPPPAPLDPYGAPGPLEYAPHGMPHPPGHPAMRPQGRPGGVGGPRDPRQPGQYAYASEPSGLGMGYPTTAAPNVYAGQQPPDDSRTHRRGSGAPSIAPSITPSAYSSASTPYGTAPLPNGSYAARSQPALNHYPAPGPPYPSTHGPSNGYGMPERRRVDSGGYTPSFGSAHGERERARADGLTPAQAYQEAEGYGRSVHAPSPTGPSAPPTAGSGIPPHRHQSGGSMSHHSDQRVPSGSSGRTARNVAAPNEGFTSPPPGYFVADALPKRDRDGATPPQLPDLVTESQTFDFLEDLERLGLGGDLDERAGAARGPSRDEAISPKTDMPTSLSSGSLGSQQRHYADEIRDRLTPVTQRQEYGGRSGHRRQYSDSSVVSTSTVQSNMTRNLPYIDTAPYREDRQSSVGASSPAATIAEGFAAATQRRLSGRASSESVRSMPQGLTHTRSSFGSGDVRTGSFSSNTGNREEAALAIRSGSISKSRNHGRPTLPALPPSSYNFPSPSGSATNVSLKSKRPSGMRKTPTVYPAMMSAVAEVFKQMIPLGDRLKDGLTYKDSFDGREAVDLIADIIRTSDRNLALLLGRALDAQRFFHDVTYDHRLRDSGSEIYRFRERLLSPFVPGEAGADGQLVPSNGSHRPAVRPSSKGFSSGSLSMTSHSLHSASTSPAATPATSTTTLALTAELSTRPRRDSAASSEDALPVGVFTLLTDCYSPTCTIDSLCYSINCPRRLEQQRRNNLKIVPGLTRKISEESLVDVKETGTLWIHTVSKEIADSVDEREQRRQEAINELIYTERDFVRDLEYLLESWVKPLRKQDVIPQTKREDFVTQVFWNVHEIFAVNQRLAERLTKRQKHEPVVSGVADILNESVPLFEPFVTYGAHQLFGKYEFEKEKGSNPAFQRFVDETERDPSSRKLELNGYLTKPTTRLARYPLLLEAILKQTPDDHPDKEALPEVVKQVRAFLKAVNTESGKSENMFNLAQLDQQLIFRPGENIDLHLRDKNRELVYRGPLKSRGGTQSENADLLVFLFDHALLLVKPKWVNKHEQYKVYRKPIPLELLVVTSPDEVHNATRLLSTSRGKPAAKSISGKSAKDPVPKPESKHGYSLTLIHLGRKGYSMTLWAPTFAGRRKWLEHFDTQQQKLRERSLIFETAKITEGFFGGANKLNCAAPYDAGRRMIYGAENGVYFSNLFDDRFKLPTMVLALHDVTQVDVLEEFQLLVVLAERSVTTYPLEALDPSDPSAALKRGKHLSSHTSFFKSGMCLSRTLLCIVKSSSLSTTIKTLEPVDLSARGKKQPTPFKRLLNNSNEPFKVFKEFYIPTESSSISFLKTKLCVATTKGFEVVDLETLDTQGLLDPSDASLDFVSKRESVRPIAIYRVEENFLLCYAEFAFYVNKTGWRARPKWGIQWEGFPTAFGLHYPYVLAFEPSFVEVRHVETGNLVQIITGNNIRCLFAETPPSTVNAPPPPMQMYRPGMAPPPQPYGHPQQQMYGYNNMQQPYMAAPRQRVNVRSQIIFVSDEGRVQIMKIAQPPNRDSSGSGSIARR